MVMVISSQHHAVNGFATAGPLPFNVVIEDSPFITMQWLMMVLAIKDTKKANNDNI